MKIVSTETLLTGQWLPVQDRVVADVTCKRIIDLTTGHLILLGRYVSLWDALYSDPDDGRLWELTYPQSWMQGGGAPQLQCLTKEEAKKKYGSCAFSQHAKGLPATTMDRSKSQTVGSHA